MGIKDDLAKAEEAVRNIITWDRAIELICAQSGASKSEVARWLILKQVHLNLESYSLNPTIPLAEKVDESITERYLQQTVSPSSWLSFLFQAQNASKRLYKMEAVDIRELNAFLQSKNADPIAAEPAKSAPKAEQKSDISETLPQRRVRMIVEALSGDEGYSDIRALPKDAKSKLKDDLLDMHPQVFTESTFIKAWSDASASGLIGIADKAKYTPKG